MGIEHCGQYRLRCDGCGVTMHVVDRTEHVKRIEKTDKCYVAFLAAEAPDQDVSTHGLLQAGERYGWKKGRGDNTKWLCDVCMTQAMDAFMRAKEREELIAEDSEEGAD